MTVAAVHGSLRPARIVGAVGAIEEVAVTGGRLFFAPLTADRDVPVLQALSVCHGGRWSVVRAAGGEPIGRDDRGRRSRLSISRAGGFCAIAIGRDRLGLDIETLDRVALNTTPEDDWLDADEQALLAGLDPTPRLHEIACRWMMREAYGKAVGQGLAAPRADATGWTFEFGRHRDLLFAVASGGHAVGAVRQEPADTGRRKIQRAQHL